MRANDLEEPFLKIAADGYWQYTYPLNPNACQAPVAGRLIHPPQGYSGEPKTYSQKCIALFLGAATLLLSLASPAGSQEKAKAPETIGSVNRPLPASALTGKFYEWSYSRVYLSRNSTE